MRYEGRGRLTVRSRRIVTPTGLVDGTVVIEDGRIAAVLADGGAAATGDPGGYDATALVVLPGLVDTHVHVNEPGRTDWEGYETATRAAAAGGITTLVDMPLNCIPVTTSLAALETKLAALAPARGGAAPGKLTVDCGFYGGLVPGNLDEVAAMARRGVLGFKAFMVHSGIDDFPQVQPGELLAGMRAIARCGLPLLAHAELECGAATPTPATPVERLLPEPYSAFLASRPRAWENAAVQLLIDQCRETRCRVHVVHLSSSDAVPLLAAARREGLPITAETCPHYLTFAAEEIADGDTRFKCAPPIRERANRERLWGGLAHGDIEFVVSDHSPCAPHLKLLDRGDFEQAWGGIAGLQFGLASVWAGASGRGLGLSDLARWMAERPARLVGLYDRPAAAGGRKGAVASGFDADLALWDPDATEVVAAAMVQHRHKVTPYEGRRLQGVVQATFLRGMLVYERGRFLRLGGGQPLLGRSASC